MKIRKGFVSNSSSSSFIVIFPKEPKSAEDVRKMLFGDKITHFVGLYDDDAFPVNQVAETVWNDIKEQTKNNYDLALSIMKNASGVDYSDAPDYHDFKKPGSGIKSFDWDAYDEASEKFAKKKLKEFFNERKLKLKKLNNEDVDGGVFYSFEYSDNDGSYGAALEHAGLFDKLKYLKVSNH